MAAQLLAVILADEPAGAECPRRAAKFLFAMIADDDDVGFGKVLLELAGRRESVHAAHLDVHQHPVRTLGGVTGQHVAAVRTFRDVARREKGPNGLPERGMVIDDEEFPRLRAAR